MDYLPEFSGLRDLIGRALAEGMANGGQVDPRAIRQAVTARRQAPATVQPAERMTTTDPHDSAFSTMGAVDDQGTELAPAGEHGERSSTLRHYHDWVVNSWLPAISQAYRNLGPDRVDEGMRVLNDFAHSQGQSSMPARSEAELRRLWRNGNPGAMTWGLPSDLDTRTPEQAAIDSATGAPEGHSPNAAVDNPVGAFVAARLDPLNLPSLVDEDYQHNRNDIAARHPLANFLGELVGGARLPFPGAENGLGRAYANRLVTNPEIGPVRQFGLNAANTLPRQAAAGGAYAFGYGAASTPGGIEDRIVGGLEAAPWGIGLPPAFHFAGQGVRGLARMARESHSNWDSRVTSLLERYRGASAEDIADDVIRNTDTTIDRTPSHPPRAENDGILHGLPMTRAEMDFQQHMQTAPDRSNKEAYQAWLDEAARLEREVHRVTGWRMDGEHMAANEEFPGQEPGRERDWRNTSDRVPRGPAGEPPAPANDTIGGHDGIPLQEGPSGRPLEPRREPATPAPEGPSFSGDKNAINLEAARLRAIGEIARENNLPVEEVTQQYFSHGDPDLVREVQDRAAQLYQDIVRGREPEVSSRDAEPGSTLPPLVDEPIPTTSRNTQIGRYHEELRRLSDEELVHEYILVQGRAQFVAPTDEFAIRLRAVEAEMKRRVPQPPERPLPSEDELRQINQKELDDYYRERGAYDDGTPYENPNASDHLTDDELHKLFVDTLNNNSDYSPAEKQVALQNLLEEMRRRGIDTEGPRGDMGKGDVPATPAEPTPEEAWNATVSRLTDALNNAGKLNKEQRELYRQERSDRLRNGVARARNTLTGEESLDAQLAALRGEMPRVDFEGVADQFSPAEIHDLIEGVLKHPKLSWFESIRGAEGLRGLFDGTLPTKSELDILARVFPPDFIKATLRNRSLMQRIKDRLGDALNLPRSIMSSIDMSAPFRQGIFMMGRKEWYQAWPTMFREFVRGFKGDESAIYEQIRNRPNYDLMESSGLAITRADGRNISAREEQFMSQLAERIPSNNPIAEGYNQTIGRLVRASGHAYSGFLNKLRADVFDSLIGQLREVNPDFNPNSQDVKDIAWYINNATGRGNLHRSLRSAGPVLNGVFFSPRLMASRVAMLNPRTYFRLTPVARRAAIRSLLTYGGIMSTLLTLGSLAGLKTEIDPRSSDFGKLRDGDTRWDVMGGFAQYLTLAARVATNSTITGSGEHKSLGAGVGEDSQADVIGRFFRSKESPIASYVNDYFAGQNVVGEEFNAGPDLLRRFIPMFLQDLAGEVASRGATGALTAAPGFFGSGVQTYHVPEGHDVFGRNFHDVPRTETDPAILEVNRLSAEHPLINPPSGTIGPRENPRRLTPDELQSYRRLAGEYVMGGLQDEMTQPEWRTLSDDDRREIIRDIATQAREQARDELFPEMNDGDDDETN